MITVRPEIPADYDVVHRINESAFGRPEEANLVDALRSVASPQISLVASSEGRVVGHIFFSQVTVESADSSFVALGLAPLAVDPEFQNLGIGSRLVRAGLDACRGTPHTIVFVLGHPGYYPRFGFQPAVPRGFRYEHPAPDDAFMVTELEPGAAAGRNGTVRYLPEFAGV
jgi:putative acetyltransferase